MKTIKLFLFSALLLFVSCSDNDNKDNPTDNPTVELDYSKIELDVSVSQLEKYIYITFVADTITIDWGDGSTPTVWSGTKEDWFYSDGHGLEYTYNPTEAKENHTISIIAKGLKYIGVRAEYVTIDGVRTNRSLVKSVNVISAPLLERISLAGTQDLTNLNDILDKLPKLESISISYSDIEEFDCSNKPLIKYIDLTANKLLQKVNAPSTLEELTISDCELLAEEAVALEKYKDLKSLYLSKLNWKTVDLSNHLYLEKMTLIKTTVETLNMGKQTQLTRFIANENTNLQRFIAPIKIERIPRDIWMTKCNLSAEQLNSLFAGLPMIEKEKQRYLQVDQNPGSFTCDKSIAEDKGWLVYQGYNEVNE